ncbi:uroporphyrinogen-III synthase [Leucobacter chironomi]|uniref:uroporphyrinogen-III synthase n=1 Tax=Leucobacter chironomi TaxID=491918 RepID=UPI000409F49E|nr:uroporphyrinogen-III synthase [Leucobacter chironomi]
MTSLPTGRGPGAPDLTGCRILVPRGGAAGERLAAEIRARGGLPVIAPLTTTAPPQHPAALAAAVESWNRGDYDWLVVTSANGAHAVVAAGARPGAGSVAAVGPATAEPLREHGFAVDVQPERDFSAVGLADALLAVLDRVDRPEEARRVLLPLSEIAGAELEHALAAAGHAPHRVTAYRTLPTPRDPRFEAEVRGGAVDAILVMSGSGAAETARRFDPLPESTRLVAIGGPTAQALAAHGLRADAVATRHTSDGLLDTLAAILSGAAAGRPTADHPETSHHPEGRSA